MSQSPFSPNYQPRIVPDAASKRSQTAARSRAERMSSSDPDAKWYATGTVAGLGKRQDWVKTHAILQPSAMAQRPEGEQ